MLSADVPEFIPKAQRSKALTGSDLPECDTTEANQHSAAAQPATAASHATECKEGDASDSLVPNVESKTQDSETSTLVDKTGQVSAVSASVDQVDSASANQNEALESIVLSNNSSQAPNDVNHVIENKYPNSKLSATVPEFVPANPVFLDCASTESSNSHLPYAPATSGAPYVYHGSPYGYYTPWATEIDYSSGYYSPMLNTGAYSSDFYVPDGGYVYDGADSYAQPGSSMVMDPMYYDSGAVMGGMEYPNSGVAYSPYANNFTGRGGGRGSPNYNKRPYNSQYKRGGRRNDSGRGGGRGGGGGRQPSTEIGICSQTGEMTLSKRKVQQNNAQNKSEANGWSSQPNVQASTIIKNANNWPSLAQGKPDQTSGAVTPPVESVSNQDLQLHLTNGTALLTTPTNSFSSIAKKKSANTEVPAAKQSKEAKGDVAPQQKKGKAVSVQPSNDVKNISGTDSHTPKPAFIEQSGVTSNGVVSDDVNSVSSEHKSELVSKQSDDIMDQPKLSRSSKKKAKRKQKKLQELEEKASQECVDEAIPQQNSTPPMPSMASVLSNDLKKDRISTSVAPLSNSSSLKKLQKEEHLGTKPSKDKPVVNDVIDVKPVEQTVSKSSSENVGEKDSEPKEKEEEEWITVVKRSKGKKGAMNRENERTLPLGFRQPHNGDGSGSNFRGPSQAKPKKFEKKQPDRSERSSTNHVNFPAKTIEKPAQANGKNSTESSGTVGVPSDESTVSATVTERKQRDQNDPEYKEILRNRTLKKEAVKQEKKIVRENAALQKQANARKDSKISVLQTSAQKAAGPAPKNGTFRIKSEEYPSLGGGKKAKQQLNSVVKDEMIKMNGIVQDSANGLSDEAPAWVKSSSSSVEPSNSGKCASPSHNDAARGSRKESATSAAVGVEVASTSSYSSAAAASTTVGDGSVRKKKISSTSKSIPDSPKKAKSAGKSNPSPLAPRSKVKTTDKLTIDLNFLMKQKKLGQRQEKASRSAAAARSVDAARRAVATGAHPKLPRLAVAPNMLREKGKKKSVTPIQRYKKLRAQDKENFLRLVDAQRRQNERTAAEASAADAAGADGWMDVGEETPNSPKKISTPSQETLTASDLVIAKLREELPLLLMRKQAAAAAYRYDKNMVTDELRTHLVGMLSKLVEFQKRKFAMEQIKAKSKRRYVCGIREATKKVEKLKLLVVATDVAKSIPLVTEGLSQLIVKAEQHRVPVVFGMSRLKLAQICKTLKNKKVSCVGIMNYQGTEEHVNSILALLPELRKQWQRSVLASNTSYGNSVVPSVSLSGSTFTPSLVSSSNSVTASTSSVVDSRASSSVRRPDDVAVKNSKLSKGKNGMTSSSNPSLQVSQKIVGILKDKRESS